MSESLGIHEPPFLEPSPPSPQSLSLQLWARTSFLSLTLVPLLQHGWALGPGASTALRPDTQERATLSPNIVVLAGGKNQS